MVRLLFFIFLLVCFCRSFKFCLVSLDSGGGGDTLKMDGTMSLINFLCDMSFKVLNLQVIIRLLIQQ